MNKRAIDISDIEKKNDFIQKNINYDDVRRRIRQVLDIITDKDNNKARVSQETIGKYLFPHLGADSSTQSTMSRFVNGNKNNKGDSCPDLKALGILSQLTGISLNWFLYGDSTENTTDSGIIKAHDLYRMLFIDFPTKYGMEISCPPSGRGDLGDDMSIVLKIPLETKVANEYYRYMIPDTFSWDLYSLTYDILQIHQASQSIRNNTPALDALNLGIEALINGTKNDDIILNNGILSYANTADNYIPF